MVRHFDVAVMHDYYVDRLLSTRSIRSLQREVLDKARAGGGGIHGIPQVEIRGGNAVNLAHAAARLGLRVLLITHSEPGHEHLLRSSFQGLDAELRVKPTPAGLTVAFEESVNVMLGDARGAGSFGPDLLDEKDWDALGSSRVVCSVNWAANRKGTELLVALRRRLGRDATIYLDPADFRDNPVKFRTLLRRIRKEKLADWVSMNREEGEAACRLLGVARGSAESTCVRLSRALGARLDLHGEETVSTCQRGVVESCRVGDVKPRRLTGAGDVWDAGSVYGALADMKDKERLRFANAAAKLYLESREPVPPRLEEVLSSV